MITCSKWIVTEVSWLGQRQVDPGIVETGKRSTKKGSTQFQRINVIIPIKYSAFPARQQWTVGELLRVDLKNYMKVTPKRLTDSIHMVTNSNKNKRRRNKDDSAQFLEGLFQTVLQLPLLKVLRLLSFFNLAETLNALIHGI